MEEKKEKKVFEKPEAIIIEFEDEDVIVTSGGLGDWWGKPGDEWQN